MRRVMKWTGLVLGGLLVVALIAGVVMVYLGSRQLTRSLNVTTEHIDVPSDATSIARGAEVVQALSADCHGEDLGGQSVLEDPMIGTPYASNPTQDKAACSPPAATTIWSGRSVMEWRPMDEV